MATTNIAVTTTLANDSVTNAKLANAPEATIKLVPVGAGTSNPIDGDADQASEILDGATNPFARTSALAPYIQDGQTLSTGLAFPSGGLRVKDNASSQELGFVVGEDLTANRQLTILVGDADRTLDIADLLTQTQADALYDPLTQNRPNNTTPDLSFHEFPVYDPGDAQSEKTDGVEIKAWLAGEFDALGAAAAALVSANAYTDASVVGLFDDRGNWDASGNLFPATGGSGTAGAILKGDVWRVSVAGTLGGEVADVGDSFRALVDTPGQTAANWALFAANTQQATESVRGTLAIATSAEAIDQASTNDIDAVTPVKWWAAFTSGVTFATAPAALLTSIRSTLLTGLSVATSTAVAATDSILVAFGKLQAFNNLFTTLGLALARLANFGAVGFIRINADNTVTARTAAEMRTDLGLDTAMAVTVPMVPVTNSLIAPATYVWSNQPAALTFFQGAGRWVHPVSLINRRQAKINVFMPTAGTVTAGSKIRLLYRTQAAGYDGTVSNWTQLGSAAQIEVVVAATVGVYSSAWIDLAAGALTDVLIVVAGIDGNGADDPQYVGIDMEYR